MVSVIIPTYNRAGYIAETLESVLAQNYKDIEVIVIDDGSTDNTEEVVKPFADRVLYVKQQNSERAVSRNHGLRLSRGEFVSFLDSDDVWQPNALEEMVEMLRRVPAAGLVVSAVAITGRNGEVLEVFYPGGNAEGVMTDAFRQLLRANIVGSPSATLVRRSMLDRAGMFDEDRRILAVEDWELWTRLAFYGPIVCMRKPLVRYRRHESNSPLANMRLRYPMLVEALLRNVPLSPKQREEVCAQSAQRLMEYADELYQIQQPEAAKYCADAAVRLHQPIRHGTLYHQMTVIAPPSKTS